MSNDKLISLYKDIEISYRSNGGKLSSSVMETLSKLPQWEYENVLNFINHLNRKISSEEIGKSAFSFLYKFYEKQSKDFVPFEQLDGRDLLIAGLKRTQKDTLLTDPEYELIIPTELSKYRSDTIWGFNVVQARNLALEHAIREGFKYLLFIDDDILVPRNALQKLWDLMKKYNRIVVAADYPKKTLPLESAHTSKNKPINLLDDDYVDIDTVCALGFALIDIEKLVKKVSPPYFMEFRNLENNITMSEDAFFTHKIIHEAKEFPLVDKTIKTLHIDKIWKRIYGERDHNIKYASGWLEDFDEIRVPPKLPLILVGVPSRRENVISTDLNKLLLLRGFVSDVYRVEGKQIDIARNEIIEEALKRDADYVLFLDDDIVLEKGALMKMLTYDESIVVADYVLKQEPLTSAYLTLDERGIVYEKEIAKLRTKEDLAEINWLIGMGAALIKTEVFKQIRKPWFQVTGRDPHTKELVHEDAYFTERCITNGYTIYMHLGIKTVHLDLKEKKAYSYYNPYSDEFASFDWIKQFEWKHELLSENNKVEVDK